MVPAVVCANKVHILGVSQQLNDSFVKNEISRECIIIEAQYKLVCQIALCTPGIEFVYLPLLRIHWRNVPSNVSPH